MERITGGGEAIGRSSQETVHSANRFCEQAYI